MKSYNYSSNFHVPSVFATLTVGSAWLAFIAVALALSVNAAPSLGDAVIRFLLAVGAVIAAVGFLLAGLRFRDSDEDWESALQRKLRSVPESSPVRIRVNDRVA